MPSPTSGSGSQATPTPTATPDPTATGGITYAAGQWGEFTTPTGAFVCDIEPTLATCKLSPSIQGFHAGDMYAFLAAEGSGTLQGDGPNDEDGSGDIWGKSHGKPPRMINDTYVLDYGSSITAGSITCKSATDGISCTNGVAGFTVSRDTLTLTGRRAPQPGPPQ